MRAMIAAVSGAEARAAGDAAARHLLAQGDWCRARSVLVYAAVGGEIDPQAIAEAAWQAGKRVFLPSPRPDDRALEPVEWVRGAALVAGPYGIAVPATGRRAGTAAVDLAVVPGLAFDRTGARLGSGLGYYDRWLAAHPGARRVGLAHSWQVVDAVPVEGHDVRLEALVTPGGYRLCARSAP